MNRFNMVFAKDLRSSWPSFRTTFIIICCIPVAVWLFNLVLGSQGATEIAPIVRRILVYASMCLVAIMAPSRIYRTVNIPNEGIYYAMLPASKREKFWSQVLVSYVCMPVAALLTGIAIDLFLTLLPFGSYVDWIWQGWPLMSGDNAFTATIVNREAFYYFFGSFGFMFVTYILGLLATSTTFFFTNTVFKKNKVAKTILWIIIIGFVMNMISTPVAIAIFSGMDIHDLLERLAVWAEWDTYNVIRFIFWLNVAGKSIWIAVFTWWGGRRLKKMNY